MLLSSISLALTRLGQRLGRWSPLSLTADDGTTTLTADNGATVLTED